MTGPRVVVNSLPKSGTNLVASVLAELPGLAFQKITLNRRLRWHPLNWVRSGDTSRCLVGVDQPHAVRMRVVAHRLRALTAWRYTAAHLPFSHALHETVRALGVRMVFVIRDPRDVVVSQMHYVVSRRRHFMHRYYMSLPDDRARLLAAIMGVPARGVTGIAAKMELIGGWLAAPDVLTVRFEDLIGEAGAGDALAQRRTVSSLAAWIGVPLGDEEAAAAGRRAFGTGVTYRRGRIGGWREAFDDGLTAAFEHHAGHYVDTLGYRRQQARS